MWLVQLLLDSFASPSDYCFLPVDPSGAQAVRLGDFIDGICALIPSNATLVFSPLQIFSICFRSFLASYFLTGQA
jgi:hypothetical protein